MRVMPCWQLTVVLAVLFVGTTHAAPVSYSDAVLADNPEAYWRFNETDAGGGLVDHAGTNNGTFTGSPVFGEPGALIADNDPAIRWDPSDGADWATVTNLPITASFTVELWAKSATPTFNTNGWFASSRDPNGFIQHPWVNSKRWAAYAMDSGGNYHQVGEIDMTGDQNIMDWHFYAMTFDDSTNTGIMYLDGQPVVTNDSMSLSRSASDTIGVQLGRDDFGSRYGDGWLDEVAVYNEALGADRIQAHYSASLPEPTSAALLLLGMLAFSGLSGRKRARRN